MPKISALPPVSSPDDADAAPLNDTSAVQTGKWTLAGLLAWLQTKATWVTTAMIANSAVKASKTDFTTMTLGALTPADSSISTTSFSNVSGGAKSLTVPDGVTKLKVSLSIGYFDVNAAVGQFGTVRIVDEDGVTVVTASLRMVAGYAQVVPASVFGFSTVTPGESKTYTLQGKVDSGSMPLNSVAVCIEAI